MEKYLNKLEEEYSNLYKSLFNEISKVQIEEKYLERQAQTLINDINLTGDYHTKKILENMIDNYDPDLILQSEHIQHMEFLESDLQPSKNAEILLQEFGSSNPEFFAYPSQYSNDKIS